MSEKKKFLSLLIKKCKETAKYDLEYDYALKYLDLMLAISCNIPEMKLQKSKIEQAKISIQMLEHDSEIIGSRAYTFLAVALVCGMVVGLGLFAYKKV